jgi:hypothetical protein
MRQREMVSRNEGEEIRAESASLSLAGLVQIASDANVWISFSLANIEFPNPRR